MSPRDARRTSLEVEPQVVGRLRALRVEGKTVWASHGLELFRSDDGGDSFERIARAPGSGLRALLARAELPSRLLRLGLHALVPLANGGLLATVRGAVVRLAPGSDELEPVVAIERGRRPLNLCRTPRGAVYFGEYFHNTKRDEVRVWGSPDGERWDVVHTFPAGAVRHVHGVVHDSYRGGEWVLTGDRGEECGLWFTDDGFRTLEPVLRGVQRARAVSVIPIESGLVVPMDSPLVKNSIQHFDPLTGALEDLVEIPGSSFHTGRAGDLLLVSTAVERSVVNTDQRASLWASRDGATWRCVLRAERDWPILQNSRPWLQWPTLVLPSGPGDPERVFASGQAVRGLHGRLLRLDGAAVRARLPLASSSGVAEPDARSAQ